MQKLQLVAIAPFPVIFQQKQFFLHSPQRDPVLRR